MLEFRGVVVISPHYDDALFSCGAALSGFPGATVLTVYSAVPPAGTPPTDWDGRCGFLDPQQAMAVRRAEDGRALALLQAQGRALDMLDPRYGGAGAAPRLRGVLAAALTLLRPQLVLLPLGLAHADQGDVGDAVLAVMPLFAGVQWLAYEELIHRDEPGRMQARLSMLQQRRVSATPTICGGQDHALKQRALAECASQLRGLDASELGGTSVQPERFWRLEALHGKAAASH
ncbi:hypothetical protein CEK29_10680 [Bordetella genomosp. 5]|uniref:PIG-L family deacetylase n=1 Tax=Bordetella genomosp. 5 TaxID=1395608 RepID=A0A261TR77_9BORD|nr:PIG-L family deacetylase [Bordetella genomosp. 5]OZI43606.1 hypothetical protein CEK29_10680 [Bordetella genomosp. 5]OZI51777.1 hypothetical protein CAL25_09605 [Bordetella genomosp. 5]